MNQRNSKYFIKVLIHFTGSNGLKLFNDFSLFLQKNIQTFITSCKIHIAWSLLSTPTVLTALALQTAATLA